MAAIADVTDQSFDQEVLGSELPVLVDFWGDNCPACRRISPLLQELAEEHAGKLKVVKIHAAENASTSARFGVMAMPTIFVFSGGTVKGQIVGARPKSAFEDMIARAS